MHVHVAIESDEEGVCCIDRISPWLPILLAVSANSPYDDGPRHRLRLVADRAVVHLAQRRRRPSAFGSLAGYRRACERMIASGAARDPGMLYFDARLSERSAHARGPHLRRGAPTRRTSECSTALVRALVETAADDWRRRTSPVWRAEELQGRAVAGVPLRAGRPPASTLVTARPAARRRGARRAGRRRSRAGSTAAATGAGARAAWTACWRPRGRLASARRTSAPGRSQGVVDDLLAAHADCVGLPERPPIGP